VNLAFSLVPFGNLTQMMPSVLPYLRKSEFWTRGRATLDEIVAFLYSGRMQLWVAYAENPDGHGATVYGHVITEIKRYPSATALVCQYCAGESDHMRYVEETAFAVLERYARDAGCDVIEFHGRPGWRASARKHGFTTETVVYEKYIGEAP